MKPKCLQCGYRARSYQDLHRHVRERLNGPRGQCRMIECLSFIAPMDVAIQNVVESLTSEIGSVFGIPVRAWDPIPFPVRPDLFSVRPDHQCVTLAEQVNDDKIRVVMTWCGR